jgi:hypothetical protein
MGENSVKIFKSRGGYPPSTPPPPVAPPLKEVHFKNTNYIF